MGGNRRQKRKKQQGLELDDLENVKTQNAMFGMLGKQKPIVLGVLIWGVLSIVCKILTLLMAFGIM